MLHQGIPTATSCVNLRECGQTKGGAALETVGSTGMAKGNGVQRGTSPPAKAQAKYGQERAVYCNIATKSLVGRSFKKTAEDSKTETRSGQCSAQIGQVQQGEDSEGGHRSALLDKSGGNLSGAEHFMQVPRPYLPKTVQPCTATNFWLCGLQLKH